MDPELVPADGVLLLKLGVGLKGVVVGRGGLVVDGDVNKVGISGVVGVLVARLELELGQLGVGGNLGRSGEHGVKFIRGEIHLVQVLPVLHGDGKGQNADVQRRPQVGGDVGGGIRQKLNTSHNGLLIKHSLVLLWHKKRGVVNPPDQGFFFCSFFRVPSGYWI